MRVSICLPREANRFGGLASNTIIDGNHVSIHILNGDLNDLSGSRHRSAFLMSLIRRSQSCNTLSSSKR
jgi:hypothetical protein